MHLRGRLQRRADIALRLPLYLPNVDAPTAKRIIHTLDNLPLLHDLVHDAGLAAPPGIRAGPQRLVPRNGIADKRQRRRAASRQRDTASQGVDAGARGRGEGGEGAVRGREVEDEGEACVEGGEGDEAHGAGGPEVEVELGEAQGGGVDAGVVGAQEVDVEQGQAHGGEGDALAPAGPVVARDEAGGCGGEEEEVEDVRSQEGGERVVEVGAGLIGGAEGAGEDFGAVLEVEEAGFKVDKLGAEGLVVGGEDVVGAEGAEAVEEDVGVDLEAGLSHLEDVFWGEERSGPNEEEERG